MTQLAASPTPDSFVGQYWQWQGHNIHYVQAGSQQPNKPALLLVHGFGASTDHWRKNLSELQHQFHVWAIDLLGFGRSAKPQQEYSGQVWQAQLRAFIEEVIGQPVVVAGNSLGGYASLCVAADFPEQVKGVILLNSAGPFSDQMGQQQQPKRLQKLLRSLLLQPLPSYLFYQWFRRRSNIRKTLKKVYVDPAAVTDRLVEEIYRPSCDPGAPQVFASVFKVSKGEAVDKLLNRMTMPLLGIWGEGDPWMKVKDRSERFRQHYDQYTEHFLSSGHCPHDEDPESVNRLMADWVEKISS